MLPFNIVGVMDDHLPASRSRVEYGGLSKLISLMTGDEKHSTSATSTLDVLWVLYDRVLKIDPQDPDAVDRDRFLLSKGHGPMAYYAVLAAKASLIRNCSAHGYDTTLRYPCIWIAT